MSSSSLGGEPQRVGALRSSLVDPYPILRGMPARAHSEESSFYDGSLAGHKRETPDRCPFPHIYRASAKRARKDTTDCKRFSRQKPFLPPAKTCCGWYKSAISAVSTGSGGRSDFLSPPDWLMVVFGSRAEEEISGWYRTT